MKNILLTFLLLIIITGVGKTQILSIEKSINANDTIDLSKKNIQETYGIKLSCNVTLTDKNSLVRIILIDNNEEEILLNELYYPLYKPGNHYIDYCEEENFIKKGISPIKILVYCVNSKLDFENIQFFNKESVIKERLLSFDTFRENKIDRLNRNLEEDGFLWRAGETQLSLIRYSSRNIQSEDDYNSHGFEYYDGGIFSSKSPAELQDAKIITDNYVHSFDWRDRHGATNSSSPYWDGDPDVYYDSNSSSYKHESNGWMTGIKCQRGNNGAPWDRCHNGCFLFAPTSAVEAIANLYFNKHIDYNLSEQDAMDCNPYKICNTSDNCYKGGHPDSVLKYYKYYGVVDEECLPYVNDTGYCEAKCNNPAAKVKITNYQGLNSSEIEIKNAIIKGGPMHAALFSHSMCLIGYGTVYAGMTIETNNSYGNIYIDKKSLYIGRTFWMLKNSRTVNDGHKGYVYTLSNNDQGFDELWWLLTIQTPIIDLQNPNLKVLCRDEDNDGFYNWGIGTKPSYCPPCPALADGDDSNPNIGPLDDAGFYSYSLPYNFSFEQDDGTWWQSSNDDINWTRHSGATPSLGTGPSSAQQGSYYMYIEGSSPNFPYKKAALISPSFDLSTLCNVNFSFYYNMYGSNIGSLSVQISTDGGNSWSNNIWSKSGNQGIGWKNATVNLSSYAGNLVKIKFIAVTGSGINNVLPRSHIIGDSDDIAIDNISLNSSLSSPLIVSNNQTWSSYTSLCQNLTVQSGAILTITGAVIMPKQAIITVKTGSKLIVTGGKITNANIIVESGGELKLENNGICVLNDNDNLTIDNGAEFNFVSGEIK